MVNNAEKSSGLWRVGGKELEYLYEVVETGFKGIYAQKFEEKFSAAF